MDKEYFLKIIIPNYNNYIYIKKCLDSILNQSFTDWFCIVIDDMSTDHSDEIAEIYQKKYPEKFKLIRMNHKGCAGGCRNAGLQLGIKSKYTYFVDSDDFLYDSNAIRRIYDASKNNPDLIECRIVKLVGNKCTPADFPKDPAAILQLGTGPCKHCINSKFDRIPFIENRAKSNDMLWGIRVFDSIDDRKIAFTDGFVYAYRIDSVTSCQHNTKLRYNIDAFEAQNKLIDDLMAENFNKTYCNRFKCEKLTAYRAFYSHFQKKLSITDVFKNSYVISIDQKKLTDFYTIFRKSFNGVPLPKFHQGSHDKRLTGPQNCARSHIDIVRQARYLGLPYVMIFEDDAYPCIDAYNTMQRYLNFIPTNARLVLLGWSKHSQRGPQSFDNFMNPITTLICGSHSYILFREAYDDYINFFYHRPNATADCDVFCAMKPSFVLNKPLFIQYSGNKSMNKHIGYIFYGDHESPPTGFEKIDNYGI